MSVRMIQDRLDGYGCRTALEEEQTLREITQEIVLAAIGRTDFFQKSGFQGGTCLRIFHGLNRFSEDLDFALLAPDSTFVLRPYLEVVTKELTAYGYGLEIDDRTRANRTVRMPFLKDDSLGHLLRLAYRPATGPLRKLRIKLEVDANPPVGGPVGCVSPNFPSRGRHHYCQSRRSCASAARTTGSSFHSGCCGASRSSSSKIFRCSIPCSAVGKCEPVALE